MKRLAFLLLIPLLLVCSGCDDWFEILFPDDDTPESYIDSPVDPVVPNTSIEVPFELEDDEDNIANTDFDCTVSIVYSAGGATVTGDEFSIVTASGNAVTVNNTTGKKVRYELSGSASDGFFKIYGEKKQAIVLNGLNLTNPNGAAINNQNKKRTFVVLQGANKLADGKKYSATPEGEDEKAAFFSEAQLIFSGSGSLEVTAIGKAGITSDDYVRVLGTPAITITSAATACAARMPWSWTAASWTSPSARRAKRPSPLTERPCSPAAPPPSRCPAAWTTPTSRTSPDPPGSRLTPRS